MKEVTRDVALDLLPLYLAGEVSEDTAALVKECIESDPELAEIAKQMAKADSLNKVPIPFNKEILAVVLMCFFMAMMVGTSVESLRHFFVP